MRQIRFLGLIGLFILLSGLLGSCASTSDRTPSSQSMQEQELNPKEAAGIEEETTYQATVGVGQVTSDQTTPMPAQKRKKSRKK